MRRVMMCAMTAMLLALTACESTSMSMPSMPSMPTRRDSLEKRAERIGEQIMAAAADHRVQAMASAGEFKDVASFASHIPDQLDALGDDLADGSVSATGSDTFGDERAISHRIILMGMSGNGVVLRLRYDEQANGFHIVSIVRAN